MEEKCGEETCQSLYVKQNFVLWEFVMRGFTGGVCYERVHWRSVLLEGSLEECVIRGFTGGVCY